MLKRLFAAGLLAAAVFGAGFAIAQVTVPTVTSIGPTDLSQVIPRGQPVAGNVYATMLQLQAYLFGGNSQRTGVTAPALTSCGGGTPAVAGNDYAGTVTLGTSATGCVITFNTAYVAAPSCAVTSRTAPATTTPAYTISAAAITITQTSTSSNLYDYVCVAKAGG